MKSESLLGGFRGHVARFVSVSHGFVQMERKVSLFELELYDFLSKKERVIDRHEEKAMGFDKALLLSA
jgi:hypothetical protein